MCKIHSIGTQYTEEQSAPSNSIGVSKNLNKSLLVPWPNTNLSFPRTGCVLLHVSEEVEVNDDSPLFSSTRIKTDRIREKEDPKLPPPDNTSLSRYRTDSVGMTTVAAMLCSIVCLPRSSSWVPNHQCAGPHPGFCHAFPLGGTLGEVYLPGRCEHRTFSMVSPGGPWPPAERWGAGVIMWGKSRANGEFSQNQHW